MVVRSVLYSNLLRNTSNRKSQGQGRRSALSPLSSDCIICDSRVQSLNKIVCYRQELDEEERTRACSRNVEIDGLAVDMDAAFTVRPSKCFLMQGI